MQINKKNCIQAGLTVIIVFLIIHYWSAVSGLLFSVVMAASPLVMGGAIAYAVNILMTFFEKHFAVKSKSDKIQKIRRPVCMTLAFIALLLIIYLICIMIIPELTACIKIMVDKIPSSMNAIYLWLNERLDLNSLMANHVEYIPKGISDWKNVIEKAVDVVMNGVGGAMDSVVSVVTSVFSTIITVVVGIIFSIYILLGKKKLAAQANLLMDTFIGERIKKKILYVFRTFNASFHNFIVGQSIEAVILGGLCVLGMLLLRLPYATMIGCLVGFTALIPVAGAYIGAIVGALMICAVSPIKAVIFLIFIIILQQLEGNIIYPKVVGNSIGLPGMWVLAAITIGGGLFGVLGIILGVPIAAGLYQMLRHEVQRRNAMLNGQSPEQES